MAKYYNASIRNLVYRLRKFKPVLESALKEEVENNADFLTDAVRIQLDMGLDGFYDKIQPPYAPRTIKNKIRKGQPTDRVTLKDTGEFYASLHVEFDEDGFRIVSNDDKSKYLLAKYGNAIFRLPNEDFTRFLRFYIRPALTYRMKEYLENGGT